VGGRVVGGETGDDDEAKERRSSDGCKGAVGIKIIGPVATAVIYCELSYAI
jgi:hypothetical protein